MIKTYLLLTIIYGDDRNFTFKEKHNKDAHLGLCRPYWDKNVNKTYLI